MSAIIHSMADFNRSARSSRGGRGGGFKKRDFNDRSSRGRPVEMHKAICDKCGNECDVPFRPTSGKPIFCRNCFEKNGSTEFRRSESQDWNQRRSNSSDREMFEAVCANCGKDCKVPFRPTSGRPVYCSDCFEKGNNEPGNNNPRNDVRPQGREQSNYNQQFEALNTKLDSILKILGSAISEEVVEETVSQPVVEQKTAPKVKKTKAPKR